MEWETVIGIETHVQLSTQSKIFSGASTGFGAAPNAHACEVDLALPGVLPVLNKEAVDKALRFGIATQATINQRSIFARKNYFYPDLPKGYQISQLEIPIVEGGSLAFRVDGIEKTINLTRAHLEEDAGKSLHEDFLNMSGIDLNRAGTPLLEIVSEPDMRSAKEAVAYAKYIHQLVTYLGISDGNMAEGSLRCDANVSIRPSGATEMGTRTETKNVNSFRFLERAINFEVQRQQQVLESGGRIVQETRLFDPDRDETRPMRSKETAMDYRYFPEPDLLPVKIDEAFISEVKNSMPELPREKATRFADEYQLTQADAQVLASDPALANYFEATVQHCHDAKTAANWVRVELLGRMNRDNIHIKDLTLSAEQFGVLLSRISDRTISGKIAKDILDALWQGEAQSVDEFIEKNDLKQVSDSGSLAPLIEKIIADNPKQAEQYRQGKTKLLGFFVGQVMKETAGKANPQQVNELVRKKLS